MKGRQFFNDAPVRNEFLVGKFSEEINSDFPFFKMIFFTVKKWQPAFFDLLFCLMKKCRKKQEFISLHDKFTSLFNDTAFSQNYVLFPFAKRIHDVRPFFKCQC